MAARYQRKYKGVIRQFLPKCTDLSIVTQDELNAIAFNLNSRPSRVLDYQTPTEVFVSLLGLAKICELAFKQVLIQ